MEALSVDQLSSGVIGNFNTELGEALEGDCVLINCPMYPPLDDEFRVVMEELTQGKTGKSKHLIVILQTSGGLMETVERLVSAMRHH